MGNTSSVPGEGKLPDALSVPVAPSQVVDGLQTTPILRGAGMEGKPLLKTAFPDATTLYGAFQRGLRVARDQPCLGHRIPAEDGSLTTAYDWKTYEQVAELRDIIGSEMVRRDWLPEVEDQGITVRPFGLFSKNRWEWTTACMAGDAYGGVSVALYDTLGEEALTHILEQTEIRVVFAGLDQLKILLKVRTADPEKTSKLTNVVSFGKPDDEILAAADKAGLEIIDLTDLIAAGREHEVKAHTPPKPEDVATINYTSGTTSLPKGAVLTHVNMVSSVCNALSIVDKVMGDKPSDWVHLSYLPASHIFERAVQALFVLMGGRIGFFCGDIRQLSGDLTSLRPTMFPTVPRLLSRFKDKVALNISKASTVVQTLYGWGYEAKKANLEADGTTTHSIYDRLVFSGVAAKLGLDRCKLMASGSAPLAEEVHQFFRTVLPGVPLVEAYGLTETAPSVTAADVRDTMTTGHVGSPLPSCEVRLMSVPDLDYYSTDHVHRLDGKPLKRGPAPAAGSSGAGGAAASAASGGAADAEAAGGDDGDSSPACDLPGEILSDQEGSALLQCEGRGELQVRGMNVFSGYFKAPDKTKAAFTSDGWFRTGDIAICLKGSRKIKIVDRLKNIFKLAQGEYVAPEKVEGKVQGTKVVLMAWVYGDSKKSACVCVAVPDPDTFPSYCIEMGFSKAGKPEDVDVKAMCALPEVRASVLSDMTDVCKQCGLTGFERPRALRLEPNPWMPGTEEMTPSFKLKRHQLKLRYQDQLDEMYAELATGDSKGAAGAAKGGAK